MIDEKDVKALLERVGAILDGHFVYASDLHGSKYVNKDALYPELEESEVLATCIALSFVNDGAEVVLGPAVGGALLARDVTKELIRLTHRTVQRSIRPVYADKEKDGTFCIKRGYDKLVEGKRVLVVEDIVNTGGSATKTVAATRACKGNVVGIGAICNRGNAKFDVPFKALLTLALETFAPEDCPLCKKGIPVNEQFGKGKEFLAKKKKS